MNILFVHSSSDLYGSDRSLLTLVVSLRDSGHRCQVILPEDGPLADELRAAQIPVHATPAAIKVENSFSSVKYLGPRALLESQRFFDGIHRRERIDLVHSNTSAVLGGAMWAKRRKIPHVWTVREILANRPFVSRLLATALDVLSVRVTWNSRATGSFWSSFRSELGQKGTVIHNAIEVPASSTGLPPRTARDRIAILLVGRINGWKGHGVLAEAVAQLPPALLGEVTLTFAGSTPPGGLELEHDLRAQVDRLGIGALVHFPGFVSDMSVEFQRADIVVAPSTRPEPFGRVPIEAAQYSLPVIASDEGGYRETIEHGVTGLLVEPRNPTALSRALEELIVDEEMRARLGSAAKSRWGVSKVAEMVAAYAQVFENVAAGATE